MTTLTSRSTNVLASPKPTLAFDQAAFFASLRQHSTPFQLRKTKSASSSHLIGFYERFVRGPNLRPWLAKRIAEADTAIRERYVNGLATADVDGWAKRNASARDMDELLSRLQTEVVRRSRRSICLIPTAHQRRGATDAARPATVPLVL